MPERTSRSVACSIECFSLQPQLGASTRGCDDGGSAASFRRAAGLHLSLRHRLVSASWWEEIYEIRCMKNCSSVIKAKAIQSSRKSLRSAVSAMRLQCYPHILSESQRDQEYFLLGLSLSTFLKKTWYLRGTLRTDDGTCWSWRMLILKGLEILTFFLPFMSSMFSCLGAHPIHILRRKSCPSWTVCSVGLS
jgi:hypothetical protein